SALYPGPTAKKNQIQEIFPKRILPCMRPTVHALSKVRTAHHLYCAPCTCHAMSPPLDPALSPVSGGGVLFGSVQSPGAVVLELENRVVVGREVMVFADAQIGDRRFRKRAIDDAKLLRRERLDEQVEEGIPWPGQEQPGDGDQVLLALGEGVRPIVL